MKLNFYEDFLPVQQQHRYEADEHKGNGVHQRSEGRINDGKEPVLLDELLQVGYPAVVMHPYGVQAGGQEL